MSENIQNCNTEQRLLLSTYDDSIKVSATQIAIPDFESIQPCSHEEADSRIILHAAHCAKQGYKRISIRTVDTDVVVLAVSHFQKLGLDELWICFGSGKHYRNISIHMIAETLGEKTGALLFFHAFTGCDTVSSFRGKGKKSAWSTWQENPSMTETFIRLMDKSDDISEELFLEIQIFVIRMYSKNCPYNNINEARKHIFAQGGIFENIPPTEAALLQHVKRAVYQACYVWAQSLIPCPILPSPENWGYKQTPHGWKPHWTDLPEAATSSTMLVKCGCVKGCNYRCKCQKLNLQCTQLCKCKGDCSEIYI